MVKQMAKYKRRLTEIEVAELSRIMSEAPMGHKPTIRQFARYFGVTRVSIKRSLGGWDGIERNRPDKAPKPLLPVNIETSPISIEPHEFDVSDLIKR